MRTYLFIIASDVVSNSVTLVYLLIPTLMYFCIRPPKGLFFLFEFCLRKRMSIIRKESQDKLMDFQFILLYTFTHDQGIDKFIAEKISI